MKGASSPPFFYFFFFFLEKQPNRCSWITEISVEEGEKIKDNNQPGLIQRLPSSNFPTCMQQQYEKESFGPSN